MDFTVVVVLIICIIIISIISAFGYYTDYISFNNGKCIRCGYPLELFDKDSQGGRGYKCKKCGFQVWASWPVDRNFRSGKK